MITKQYWRHARSVLRQQGVAALGRLVLRKLSRLVGGYQQGDYDFDYVRWQRRREADAEQSTAPVGNPSFSIVVPVYNVDAAWLEMTVQSVINQTYSTWQCLLVDDHSSAPHVRPLLERLDRLDRRIQVLHREQNGGIAAASQTGVTAATGEYIALLDHDDLLAHDALREVALVLDSEPSADFIYSDEDKINIKGRHSSPFFKPDYSPELLESQNYVGHLLVLKRTLVEAIGGFRPGFDGAQDYDLVLRASRRAERICHIPKVLYHWRQIPGSTALGHAEKNFAAEAGRRALQQHVDKTCPGSAVIAGNIDGTYHVDRPVIGAPAVSVIIPFRDKPALLERCLDSLFHTNTWRALEVICVDNQSTDPEIDTLQRKWEALQSSIRFLRYDSAFNFAAICNSAVREASGDYVVLLNNDVEMVTHGWIELLLGHAVKRGVGAVGARLSYPDGGIQHAGIVIGIGGSAGHPFKGFPDSLIGYYGRLQISSNVSAVTGALLMAARNRWLEVGGMDEDRFGIAFNDVDLCLRFLEAGYRNVLEARCRGIHAESRTRGRDSDADKSHRFERERQAFQDRWAHIIARGDPFYNPNLTLDAEDYSLNWRTRSAP